MKSLPLRDSTAGQQGFSVVEVLLATTVFGVLVAAIIGAVIYGRQSVALAGDRARANLIAEEGLEAVHNIRDANYAGLTNGTHGIAVSSGAWNLSGTQDTTGVYTRQVTIADNGANRKLITSRVAWGSGSQTKETVVTTQLANWASAIVQPVTTGPTMMVYSKTTNTPFYRIWNGTTWGDEGSALTVGGNINYLAAKSSTKRNEVVLGTQDSSGAIYFQVWNGTSWGNRVQVGTGPTTTRSFDIAYEKTTGRAMIAYSTGVDFAYRIWDGTTLSAATSVTASPTTGTVNWIELRQNPVANSNDLAMIMFDANADIYGMRWTGTAWNNLGTTAVWDSSASTATRKGIDVEYEQNSGNILFVWGDATATDLRYRTWDGTTLSAANLLDVPAMGGITNWVQMAARPNSDEILLGFQDAASDLNTRKWSGSAWDTATQHPEHDGTVDNVSTRTFDIIWDKNPSNAGKAWLVWGNAAGVQTRQWSGTAWGAASTISGSDDTSFVRLQTNANGAVFAALYESSLSASDDIWETRILDGSINWTIRNTIWAGPTSVEPVYFRIDIASP